MRNRFTHIRSSKNTLSHRITKVIIFIYRLYWSFDCTFPTRPIYFLLLRKKIILRYYSEYGISCTEQLSLYKLSSFLPLRLFITLVPSVSLIRCAYPTEQSLTKLEHFVKYEEKKNTLFSCSCHATVIVMHSILRNYPDYALPEILFRQINVRG